MKTSRRFAPWLALALVACSAVSRREGLPAAEVAAFPPEVASAYVVFAARCSKCHTLARPLSASIEQPAHWRAYVERMRRQPGSGISREDAEVILVFLDHYATARPAERTSRTVTSSAAAEDAP